MRASWMTLLIGDILLGCGPTPPPPERSPAVTAIVETAPPPEPARAWENVYPQGLPRFADGVTSYGYLTDGRVVAAVTWSSEAEPLLLFTGKPGTLKKKTPPWQCEGDSMALEISGQHAWINCPLPLEPGDEIRRHFWHSSDGGETWSRAGVLDGLLSHFHCVVAGPTLFASGVLNGRDAPLHRVDRVGSAWKISVPAAEAGVDMAWMAASLDGTLVASVGTTLEPPGFVITASLDGGKTVKELWRGPWTVQSDATSISIVRNRLSFWALGKHERAVVALGLDGESEPTITTIEPRPALGCVHGDRVAVRWSPRKWATSTDAGKTFTEIPPGPEPKNDYDGPACSARGVQMGDLLWRWRS